MQQEFDSPTGYQGRLAQLGEHLPYKQGVTGSSPVAPTILGQSFFAELSSSGLGHMPVTHEIAGSNPVSSARLFIEHGSPMFYLFFWRDSSVGRAVD